MRILPSSSGRLTGATLLETLVYGTVFLLILGLSYEAFLRSQTAYRHFSSAASDIVGTTQVGEQWREEIRRASGRVRSEEEEGGSVLRIPAGVNEIQYRLRQGSVWRRSGEGELWLPILPHVKRSDFVLERSHGVSVWRWELELSSKREAPKPVPLFSFVVPVPALSAAASKP